MIIIVPRKIMGRSKVENAEAMTTPTLHCLTHYVIHQNKRQLFLRRVFYLNFLFLCFLYYGTMFSLFLLFVIREFQV